MEDGQSNSAPGGGERPTRALRGLYRHVKISVRALDITIVCCIAVILIFLVLGLQDPGFVITFDSRGGSDVASQKQMYGEALAEPEPPTREGYTFTGWHMDPACQEQWNPEWVIGGELTLYAGWEEEE